MKTVNYPAKKLVDWFKRQKIGTMQELKEALGTQANITVLRKLKELSYQSSYSHRGRYYTLKSIPQFDEWGLWNFRSIWFSERGTLLATAEALIEDSVKGYYELELEELLHVEVRGCLLRLIRQERVSREKILGRYLYCACSTSRRKEQIRARRLFESEATVAGPLVASEIMPDELKAAIILFFAMLDEQQRRLYAGLESLKLGHGGDQRIADLLGLDRSTVAKGRNELLAQDVEVGRVRQSGGGRKATEKKRRK